MSTKDIQGFKKILRMFRLENEQCRCHNLEKHCSFYNKNLYYIHRLESIVEEQSNENHQVLQLVKQHLVNRLNLSTQEEIDFEKIIEIANLLRKISISEDKCQ